MQNSVESDFGDISEEPSDVVLLRVQYRGGKGGAAGTVAGGERRLVGRGSPRTSGSGEKED